MVRQAKGLGFRVNSRIEPLRRPAPGGRLAGRVSEPDSWTY